MKLAYPYIFNINISNYMLPKKVPTCGIFISLKKNRYKLCMYVYICNIYIYIYIYIKIKIVQIKMCWIKYQINKYFYSLQSFWLYFITYSVCG